MSSIAHVNTAGHAGQVVRRRLFFHAVINPDGKRRAEKNPEALTASEAAPSDLCRGASGSGNLLKFRKAPASLQRPTHLTATVVKGQVESLTFRHLTGRVCSTQVRTTSFLVYAKPTSRDFENQLSISNPVVETASMIMSAHEQPE